MPSAMRLVFNRWHACMGSAPLLLAVCHLLADGPATVLAWPEVLLYLLGTFSSVQEVADSFTPQVLMQGAGRLLNTHHAFPAAKLGPGRELVTRQDSCASPSASCRITRSSQTMRLLRSKAAWHTYSA